MHVNESDIFYYLIYSSNENGSYTHKHAACEVLQSASIFLFYYTDRNFLH